MRATLLAPGERPVPISKEDEWNRDNDEDADANYIRDGVADFAVVPKKAALLAEVRLP